MCLVWMMYAEKWKSNLMNIFLEKNCIQGKIIAYIKELGNNILVIKSRVAKWKLDQS